MLSLTGKKIIVFIAIHPKHKSCIPFTIVTYPPHEMNHIKFQRVIHDKGIKLERNEYYINS